MPFATESSCDGGIEGSQDMRRDQPMLKNLPANGQKGYCPVGMAMLLEAAKFLGSIEPEKARAILHAFKSHLGECDACSDFDRGSHSRFIARRMLLPRKTHLGNHFFKISLAFFVHACRNAEQETCLRAGLTRGCEIFAIRAG